MKKNQIRKLFKLEKSSDFKIVQTWKEFEFQNKLTKPSRKPEARFFFERQPKPDKNRKTQTSEKARAKGLQKTSKTEKQTTSALLGRGPCRPARGGK
jgi:hypothetical protein